MLPFYKKRTAPYCENHQYVVSKQSWHITLISGTSALPHHWQMCISKSSLRQDRWTCVPLFTGRLMPPEENRHFRWQTTDEGEDCLVPVARLLAWFHLG